VINPGIFWVDDLGTTSGLMSYQTEKTPPQDSKNSKKDFFKSFIDDFGKSWVLRINRRFASSDQNTKNKFPIPA